MGKSLLIFFNKMNNRNTKSDKKSDKKKFANKHKNRNQYRNNAKNIDQIKTFEGIKQEINHPDYLGEIPGMIFDYKLGNIRQKLVSMIQLFLNR